MSYDAKIIEVMIASPNDVNEERRIVREVLADWNDLHTRERLIAFLPTGWETHSSPDLGGRPQQLINDRILAHSDIVIGLFWTRIGSPTGKAVSGTTEEIHEHHATGRPVMLYFSNAPIPPDKMDAGQFSKVQELKAWAFQNGIVGTYDSPSEFREKLHRDLHRMLRDNTYLQSLTDVDSVKIFKDGLRDDQPSLSNDALEILRAATLGSNDRHLIFTHKTLSGTEISAGGKSFGNPREPREVARWRAAVDEIFNLGMTRDINGKREIFEINHNGYKALDSYDSEGAELSSPGV